MRRLKIHQQKTAIERLDLPAWLKSQQIYPKVYWRDREKKREHAALGNILCLDHIPRFEYAPLDDVRFYGGMRFPSISSSALWESFAPCAFWLPSVEILQSDECTELILYTDSSALLWESSPPRNEMPYFLRQGHSLSLEEWKASIARLLDNMHQGNVQKVVLARKTTLSFSSALCCWSLVDKLKERALNATVFAFQLSPDHAFLGATPEKLFSRKGKEVSIEAVAGTRKRGKNAAEDLQLQEELKTNTKETAEFCVVKDFIHRQVAPLSTSSSWLETDTVLKTAHVQHLYNQMTVSLKKGYGDEDLLAALHPTPAVGGFPQSAALDLICQLESFVRGWYASPIGWVSAKETELAIAIRSALLTGSALHLFAGAGIVSASVAEKEWEEIDHKMRLMLYGCGLAQ